MRYLLHFLWKNSAFILFLILELISLVFVVNGNRHQSAVFSTVANQYGGKIFTTYSNFRNYFHLKDANDQLAYENAFLKEKLQKALFEMDSTNFQSFDSIDSTMFIQSDSLKPLFDYIPAKIISNSTNRQKNYLMLNKGRKHGVRKNMGIIGPNGIVGVVFETSEDYSSGISLLNIKQSVSVKLKHNNVAEFREMPGNTIWYIKVKFSTDFKKLFWVNIARNLNYEQQKALEAVELEN